MRKPGLDSAFHEPLVASSCHVHLAAEDGLEGFQPFLLPSFVDLLAVVKELLYTEHVAVVGDGYAAHSVRNGLVNHPGYLGHAVEQGKLCVNV